MGKPTAESVMGDMHVTVVTKLCEEIPKVDSDPRWTAMGIKMLTDNKVFMVAAISNELGELDKHLKKKRKRKFGKSNITDIATKAAVAMNE